MQQGHHEDAERQCRPQAGPGQKYCRQEADGEDQQEMAGVEKHDPELVEGQPEIVFIKPVGQQKQGNEAERAQGIDFIPVNGGGIGQAQDCRTYEGSGI